jgi:hypothetical protein
MAQRNPIDGVLELTVMKVIIWCDFFVSYSVTFGDVHMKRFGRPVFLMPHCYPGQFFGTWHNLFIGKFA